MDQHEIKLAPIEPPRTPEVSPTPKFDKIIVFGQGPVKEIKLLSELSDEERAQWNKFIQDPREDYDPDFYAIEGEDLSEEERQKFQHLGRFALKRLGRLNALAAGYALVTGQTKELILSGGHTQSAVSRDQMEKRLMKSFEEKGQKEKIEEYANFSQAQKNKILDDYAAKEANWPSEAELMKDVIWRRFSPEFRRKFLKEHPDIDPKDPKLDEKVRKEFDKVVRTEDEATNTLENFALTIDKNPDIFAKKVGLLSVNHHLRRILILANRFAIDADEANEVSSQMELEERARQRAKKAYVRLLQTELPETVKFGKGERRWIAGLEDPQYTLYWLGYVGEIKNPATLQRIIEKLRDPAWLGKIKSIYANYDLDFQDFENADLIELAKKSPERFEKFRNDLVGLLRYRELPPESLAA